MNELEIRYLEAEFDEQVQLKSELDEAMSNFSKAKLAILKNNITCTPEDVRQMKQLRQQITNALDLSQIVGTIVQFVSFMQLRFL